MAIIAATAVLAAAIAAVLQRNGLAATPDGAVYTGVAGNLNAGRGLSAPFSNYTDNYTPFEALELAGQIPLKQWPPLFPVVLHLGNYLGASPIGFARLLNPALLGVNALLLGLLSLRFFKRAWLPLFAVLVVTMLVRDPEPVRSPFLYVHVTALTEPLFACFALGCLLVIDVFMRSKRTWTLIGAAALASAAAATKLLGLSFAATVCLVAALAAAPTAVRCTRVAACALIGVLPVLPSLAASQRRQTVVPPAEWPSVVVDAARGLSAVLPGSGMSTVGGVLVLVAVVAATAVLVVGARANPVASEVSVRVLPTLVASLLMVVQLIYSQIAVDRYVSLVGRQLSLVAALITLVLLAALSQVLPETIERWQSAALVGVLGVPFVVSGLGGVVESLRVPPFEAANSIEIEPLAPERAVFTNAPDGLFYAGLSTSYMVPCREDYFSGQPNPDFDTEMDELRALVRDGEAVVVLLGGRLGHGVKCANAFDFDADSELNVRPGSADVIVVEAAE